MFSGEFDTIIEKSTEAPIVIDAAAGIIVQPKNVTELDRLSNTITQIEHSCASVPKGAVKFTPLQKVVLNEGFKGLSQEDASSLDNWCHFRDVEQTAKKDL